MLANLISVGNVIKHKNQLWQVVKREHVKVGKGGAIIQVELKNIQNGKKLNDSFGSSEDVERVVLEDKNYQYQYEAGEELVFMNLETYEQENIPKSLLGERVAFLTDEMEVVMSVCEDKIIDVKLPEKVVCVVKETESTVKGQTAAASYKPAILENGLRVMVPPFIVAEEKIIVRTSDCSYVERAKK